MQSDLTEEYDLTDQELQRLTANKVSGNGGVSVADRLAIINNVISRDFDTAKCCNTWT